MIHLYWFTPAKQPNVQNQVIAVWQMILQFTGSLLADDHSEKAKFSNYVNRNKWCVILPGRERPGLDNKGLRP